jgi:hypothetical protein
MAYYRLYFVRDGHFVRFEEILAEDDVQAVRTAGSSAGALGLELWCGRRRVKSFPSVKADA